MPPLKPNAYIPTALFLCPNTGFFADPSGIGLSTFSDPLEIIFRVIIAIVTTVSRATRREYSQVERKVLWEEFRYLGQNENGIRQEQTVNRRKAIKTERVKRPLARL